MLGFVLFTRTLPVAAFIPIGLISVISGKRYAAYATGIWFFLSLPSMWTLYLGTFEGMSAGFKGLLMVELHKLPAYAQSSVMAESSIQQAIGDFSGIMPYVYAGVATIFAGVSMFALGWGFFALRPSLTRRLRTVAAQTARI